MVISTRERQLYDSVAVGWNTWDVASVTAHVLLPQRLRVNLAVIISERSAYSRNFSYDMVEDFGEHSLDGSYTCITVRYMERKWRIETSAQDHELVLRVTPLSKSIRAYIALEVSNIWNGKGAISYRGDGIAVSYSENEADRFIVKALNATIELPWNPSCCCLVAAEDNETLYFSVNSEKSAEDIDERLENAKAAWLGSTIRSEGNMGEALDALRRVLLWNRVFESRHNRPVTPVTRLWCTRDTSFGDYALFGWDTMFGSLLYGLFSKEMAYATCFSILDEISPDGCVPNVGGATGPTAGRSQPPVGSLCVWKLYMQHGDQWFLEECFPRLLKWNRWRFANRDQNGDGLLEPGCSMYDTPDDHIRK